ncbi:MAG: hypothetical protein JXB07_14950 [Anaerolineae bacterium]|nr:hypothetical protein [Anaerolineae bacterium]
MSEQQSKPEKPFPFKSWARYIGSASLISLVLAFMQFPDMPPFTTFQKAVLVGAALVGAAAAFGFWRERRWGLWLFMALAVVAYALGAIAMVREPFASGVPGSLLFLVGTLVVGTIFLFYLYSQRHQFK